MNRLRWLFLLTAFCIPAGAAFGESYNLLLISVDTLRADHVGAYGAAQKTPAMDRLAAQSVVFETAISQAPLTLPSHATIFTGLYPNEHGIRNNEAFRLPESAMTIAELLRSKGYATGGFVGSFALDSVFGIHQGFDVYGDRMGKGDGEDRRNAERRAEDVWKEARSWLEKQKNPWFCFVHFYDPHTAYLPPAPFPATYAGEVAYVDSVVDRVLKYVEGRSDGGRTVTVLLSDHGESLGEHGELSHGVFLYDSTLKVPLMFRAPEIAPSRRKGQARLADVAPTILELLGLPERPGSGESLVPYFQGDPPALPAYSESYYTNLLLGWSALHSIRWRGLKWIDAPRPELYNLSNDPLEQKNRYSPSAVPRDFRKLLDKYIQPSRPAAVMDQVDPELREKLASLGYIGGSSVSPVVSSYDPKDGIEIWTKIEAAVTAANLKKLAQARILFEEVLQQQPENVIAQKFLAGVLTRMGEEALAAKYLESALKSPLHQKETRMDLAKTYYRLQSYDRTLEILAPELGTNAAELPVLRLASFAALKAKRQEQALGYLTAALKLSPSDPDLLSNRARILSLQGKDEDALSDYDRLEKSRSLSEEEAIQVAALHLTARRVEKAEAYFRKALEASPDSRRAWNGLALIHAARREWEPALQAFVRGENCEEAKKLMQGNITVSHAVMTEYRQKCL